MSEKIEKLSKNGLICKFKQPLEILKWKSHSLSNMKTLRVGIAFHEII